ncbi:MAG: DinB family protein [Psychrosphaera sp.]|nr:DinB family protein [Psychrosphaera sp.]
MLNSQLEILVQGQSYLKTVTPENYTAIIKPNFISCAGAHMRHIIDHYLAIMAGVNCGLIDYDIRQRGAGPEQDRLLASEKLNQVASWIEQLSDEDLKASIWLSTEVCVSTKTVQRVQTSIARELVFAASHAVHHYAMIAQIAFAQKAPLPVSFGLAPATATFLRQTDSKLGTNLNSHAN